MSSADTYFLRPRSGLKAAAAPLALAVALLASPVQAQEADAASPSTDENRIIVTYSRIARPEAQGAAPVATIDEETLANSGQTNVTDLLKQTPALIGSIDNFQAAGTNAALNPGTAGVNLLNLRNLGSARTLVLVDGRRHVSGVAGQAGVDINTIPLALIERVDVMTGGVSPIYGADGVSGVVNFVMKRDFEGLDLRAQQGISDFGDAESTLFSVTAGRNFAQGRGNIAAAYEFRREESVAFSDRPGGRDDAFTFVQNPADVGDDPTVPDFVPLQNVGWADSAPGGAVITNSLFYPLFRGDGEFYQLSTLLPGGLSVGGDDTPVAGYAGDLQPQSEHHTFNLSLSYDLTPAVRLFAEGKYVDTNSRTEAQPSFDLLAYIPADNAYIPDTIRPFIEPGYLAGLGLPDGVLVSRDNFDLGRREERLDRSLWRGVIGLDGDLTDHARFEVSYVYGRNETTYVSGNRRIMDRYYAALDAVDEGQFLTGTPNGNIVCRSDLSPGFIEPFSLSDVLNGGMFPSPETFAFGDGTCQPLNIFGEGVADQAAIDWVVADLDNRYAIDQHVVTAYVSGDFGEYFELPGGPVGFALGGEYRKERSRFTADPLGTQTVFGSDTIGVLDDGVLLADLAGSFDVKEAFAELRLPLLADKPGAELLEVNAALRLSDYSTTGSSTSWSVSGQYAPVADVRLRGSYAKSVRAPNITELFAPTATTLASFDDPCSPINVDAGTQYRAANCAALITGLGVDYATFDYDSSPFAANLVPGLAVGNDTLDQEEAETWTAGLVLAPRMVPGLTLSVDWYDITITDAINTATLQETADFCVDAPTLDNAFCQNITRSGTTGYVSDYILSPENVAFFETAGADITLAYARDLGSMGTLDLNVTAGYLDKLNFLPANGGVVDDDRGEVGAPKWSGYADLTWSLDNWTVNYGVQYVGDQLRYGHAAIEADPDIVAPEYLVIDSRFMHDIRVQYTTTSDEWSYFAGINNFTNEQPTLGDVNSPTGWRGRYFYAGLRLRTDALPF